MVGFMVNLIKMIVRSIIINKEEKNGL